MPTEKLRSEERKLTIGDAIGCVWGGVGASMAYVTCDSSRDASYALTYSSTFLEDVFLFAFLTDFFATVLFDDREDDVPDATIVVCSRECF